MRFNKHVSNEQAFRALVSGATEAKQIILDNFENFLKAKAGQFYVTNSDHGLDYNELVLVGRIALNNAIYSYRGGAEPFAAYATVVIHNAMANYMKQYRSPTARLMRHGISLDDNLYDDNDSLLMSDSICEVQDPDCLGFYEPTDIGYFEDLLPVSLTEEELLVVEERLQGYNYQEIKEKYKFPKRKLDAIIATIKEKFRNRNE